MATTKKTAAKKAAPKKTVAKKATAAKTTTVTTKTAVAKKTTAARKAAATKASATTSAVRESITSAAHEADDTFKQYTAVAGEQLVELRKLVRDVVDIYVGIPFVLGTRFADTAMTPNVDLEALKALVEDVKDRIATTPSVDFDAVKSFVDEAKVVGHAQVATLESQIGAAAGSVSKRLRNLYAA